MIYKRDCMSLLKRKKLTKMLNCYILLSLNWVETIDVITKNPAKRLEKKLDGNYTRMLRAILNKSWRERPTRHQLYGHQPPITKTIQARRTRHAGHCWRSKDELISDVPLWTTTYGRAKAGRPARTYIQQLCEDTGTIGRSGERGSGISIQAVRHDDDDENVTKICIANKRWNG